MFSEYPSSRELRLRMENGSLRRKEEEKSSRRSEGRGKKGRRRNFFAIIKFLIPRIIQIFQPSDRKLWFLDSIFGLETTGPRTCSIEKILYLTLKNKSGNSERVRFINASRGSIEFPMKKRSAVGDLVWNKNIVSRGKQWGEGEHKGRNEEVRLNCCLPDKPLVWSWLWWSLAPWEFFAWRKVRSFSRSRQKNVCRHVAYKNIQRECLEGTKGCSIYIDVLTFRNWSLCVRERKPKLLSVWNISGCLT